MIECFHSTIEILKLTKNSQKKKDARAMVACTFIDILLFVLESGPIIELCTMSYYPHINTKEKRA
jgi:hypothetical protein